MAWPFRRFMAAYDAFQRRTLCEEWRQRKIAHLAGLAANTNLDGKEANRAEITQATEVAYDELIARIWNDEGPEEQDIDPDTEDPFERAALRSAAIIRQRVDLPGAAQIAALPD